MDARPPLKSPLNRRAVLAGLGLCALPRHASARPLDTVREARQLRVAVYTDHRPFSFMEAGEARGIDVEIARALAAHIGVPLDLVMRNAGEDVEGDLRANVWRGPLFGGGVADGMLHVPADKVFTRNLEHVVVANPYYRHMLGLMVDARTDYAPAFDLVKEARVAVEPKSLGDYYLLTHFRDSALKNLRHFTRLEAAVAAFRAGEVEAVVGPRAMLEGLMHPRPEGVRVYTPAVTPPFQRSWTIGTAVKEDSRDLSYALGDALDTLRSKGALDAIFLKYGVSPDDPLKS